MAVGVGQHAKEFDCQACSYKHCDEDGKLPGSRGAATYAAWELGGVGYRVCPMMQITSFSHQLISLYRKTSKGLLMDMLKQPNAYLQAIDVIEGCMNV